MAKPRIFSVLTPLGNRVTLTRDRWRTIIRFKHPALSGHEGLLRQCLQDPVVIRESMKSNTVHLYYAEMEKRYLCVVTAPASQGDWFVVTSYFTRNIKQGKELWKK